jgi:hypothetical protein
MGAKRIATDFVLWEKGEPMNDLISREELIDYLYENNVHADISIEDLADEIFAEPKVGRNTKAETPTLFGCSVCGWECWDTVPCDTETFNYCPNCGAKMERSE